MITMAQQNPEDQIEQAYKMAPPVADYAAAAPVDPHAALTAPIGPPAPEPVTMAPGAKMSAKAETPPTKMSPIAQQEERTNSHLMADQAKDDAPATGFFGKLLHGLSATVPGVMEQFHGTEANRKNIEEPRLQKNLQDLSKEESTEGLQGAQTGEANARTDEIKNPAEKYTTINTDQGEMKFDPKSGEVSPLQMNGKQLNGPEKSTARVLHETDQGLMLVDPGSGEVTPLTLNGKPLMPKAPVQAKPDTPEQQYLDEYQKTHQGASIADAERHYTLDTQKPPQIAPIMMMVPNANGGSTATVIRPGSEVAPGAQTAAGLNSTNTPTAQMRNTAQRAELVHAMTPELLQNINANASQLGPVMGHWNDFMQGKLGTDNPQFAQLRADLLLYSSSVALAHAQGRLPENLREEFDHMINAPKQSPQNLIAVIGRIDQAMQLNAKVMSGKAGQTPNSEPQRPANVPEGYKFNQNGPKGAGWYAPTAK